MSTPHGQGGQPDDDQDARPWSAPEPESDPTDSGATTVFRPQDLPSASPSRRPDETGAGSRGSAPQPPAGGDPGVTERFQQTPPGGQLPDHCGLPAAEAGDRRSACCAVSCAPGLR